MSRHDHTFSVSLDLKTEAYLHYDGDGSLSFKFQEVKRELNLYKSIRLLLFVRPYIFCGKSGQIAHVPLLSRGIAQKTIVVCHSAETTCKLRMDRWCQNTAHSFPISGLLNS